MSEPYFEWLAYLGNLQIDMPWCVIVTQAGCEAEVAAELAMAGWSTFVPMETIWTKRTAAHPARRRVRRPLFPRYAFAACNPGGDVSAPTSIKKGLVAVRRSAGGLSVVRLDLLARLMLTEAGGGLDLTREALPTCATRFTPGQVVKIGAGVLNGFEARILKVLNAREVRASYMLFGQEGEATFKTAELKAA
jgi:transcription antitermination factor NusG